MHVSVLLDEALEGLALERGQTVVDGTVGEGGHLRAIARRLGTEGRVVGFDKDATALERTRATLSTIDCEVTLVQESYAQMDTVLDGLGIEAVDGILLDLGWNLSQVAESGRGFSFRVDEPLVMTYESAPPAGELTAHEIVNSWPETEIVRILYEYGEERLARRIARAIVDTRRQRPITSTAELARVIEGSVPARYRQGRIHPATRTFQALRIAVNDELSVLAVGLEKAVRYLRPGGRLAVITFHSLEDRIVKHFIRDRETAGILSRINKKPITPSEDEIKHNPRSRSAKLRIAQKQEH
jgi:16S rRNA (cytosine1402-N4)-methyltransferase